MERGYGRLEGWLMASFRSLEAYAAALVRLGKDLDAKGAERIAAKMAERAQVIARSAAAADLGGDAKFSGWAPTLDTKVERTSTPGIVLLTPTRSSAGPWTVATRGRHQGGRSATGSRWNGRTRGKGTALRARATMERELPKIAETEYRNVLKQHFDVG